MTPAHPTPKAPTAAKSPRLEDIVYTGLFDAIRLGKLTLGQRLPSETDLAEEYGCSRPVIRSALAKLRENGLVISRQGAGSFVSSGQSEQTNGFGALESIDDIAGYFAFRKTIESESVSRAATRAQPADIARLRGLIDKMDELASSGMATVETDVAFHEEIAKLSDNRFLHETVVMLQPSWLFVGKFVRSLGRTGYDIGKRGMNTEHKAIVEALALGDAKAARAAMIAHIDGSERRVFKGER